MFEINPSHYRNFMHGIITKKGLARRKGHAFTLWDESLILFWNNGDVRCYKNYCPHFGLPLDQGKLSNGHIQCGLHGWKFQLLDGKIVSAPYVKKLPKCGLAGYKAFVEKGMVFVYTGDEEHFEKAKQFTIKNVMDDQASAAVVHEVPFYLAVNSVIDYPHFASHSFFEKIYGIYRGLFFKKNPMLASSYTPILLEETEAYFKYVTEETNVETTVYPFCVIRYDPVSSIEWQVFITPISKTSSYYLNTIKVHSSNLIFRTLAYLTFHTLISYGAHREDQKWLKSLYSNFKNKSLTLCDHDFHFKKYFSKFITPLTSIPKNSAISK